MVVAIAVFMLVLVVDQTLEINTIEGVTTNDNQVLVRPWPQIIWCCAQLVFEIKFFILITTEYLKTPDE